MKTKKWQFSHDSESILIHQGSMSIAKLYCGNRKKDAGSLEPSQVTATDLKNAELIAAAPELLTLLSKVFKEHRIDNLSSDLNNQISSVLQKLTKGA